MSRLLGFYGTQLRVLWEWRGGRVALLKRLVVTLVVATISFMATAWLMPRLTVDRPLDAAIAPGVALTLDWAALTAPGLMVKAALVAPFRPAAPAVRV